MSDKLGFTFYPKDWWTSESYFELEPIERYIYLECLFVMYSNDGFMKTQKTQMERRLSVSITEEQWVKITSKFLIEEGMFTHKSVNKRLRKAIANRKNGSKGGRPRKEEVTQEEKPKKPKLKTQKNPPLERERERELNISFIEFWDLYDKKVGDKEKVELKWNSLSDIERELTIKHLPKYKLSQPNKKFRKDPSTYLNNKSWNDEVIYDNQNDLFGSYNKKINTVEANVEDF